MPDRAPSSKFAATAAVVTLTGVAAVVMLPAEVGWFIAPVSMVLVGSAFRAWITKGESYERPSLLATWLARGLVALAIVYVVVLAVRAVVFVSNEQAPPGYHGIPGTVSECTTWFPSTCPTP